MRSMLCIVLAVGGCFEPHPQPGAPCAEGDRCPSGLVCVLEHCVLPGDLGSADASQSDASDASEPDGAGAGIVFVQQAYASSMSAAGSLDVVLPEAQTAGDFTLVFVTWFTPSISVSLADSQHDTFTEVQHAQVNGSYQFSVYFAKDVAAGPTTITASFGAAVAFPEVRVAQYRGAGSVDESRVSIGNNAMCSSTLNVLTPGEMIVAGNAVQSTKTVGAGTGFTIRQLTSFGGQIIEDRMVTAAGSIEATAPLTGASSWVMAGVVLRPR